MNQLLFVAVFGFCCILAVKSSDPHAECQEQMDNMYCGHNEEDKEKFMSCVEATPDDIKDLFMEKTETSDFHSALDKLCEDKEKAEEIFKTVQESGETVGMTDEKMREMLDCMKN